MLKPTSADMVVLACAANGGAVSLALFAFFKKVGASWGTVIPVLALAASGAVYGMLAGVPLVWLDEYNPARTDSDGRPVPFGRRDYRRMVIAFCVGAFFGPLGLSCFVMGVWLGIIKPGP